MIELDHFFICTDIDAPAAQRLIDFGLREGSGNQHPGQGSANRRFFFNNFMLELLWVHDLSEANSQPIDLGQRWQNRHRTCPFGLCLRPASSAAKDGTVKHGTVKHGTVKHGTAKPPFPYWSYRPPYLPPTLSIPVANNHGNLAEPMLFYLSFGQRPDQFRGEKQPPLNHPQLLGNLTRLTLALPDVEPPSPELQTLFDQGLIHLDKGERYCVTLGFDGEHQGEYRSFEPELPLILRW